MKNTRLFFLSLCLLVLVSCRKDPDTVDPPSASAKAAFTLVAAGSSCSGAAAQGTYNPGVALNASHTVTLQVNVTTPGTYSFATFNVNGFHFAANGTFTTSGPQTITLQSSGTPVAAGVTTFPLTIGTTTCSFTINVSASASYTPTDNDHMLFGNPSKAAPLLDSVNNYLMRKSDYALSYSRDRGTPNWVSWHLYPQDLGTANRQDDYRADNSLPQGWYGVPDNAYSGSGFDRGHNVPSGDRTASATANSATFLMSNMIPQAPSHNQVVWARMEDSLRALVSAGFEIYIIMGTYGSGGTGSNGYATTIHSGRVTVPANIWKVAVAIPNGNGDSSRVVAGTRVIAVNIPNNNSVNGNWKTYRTTVDAIETATGYDLLARLPESLQAVLEAKTDNL